MKKLMQLKINLISNKIIVVLMIYLKELKKNEAENFSDIHLRNNNIRSQKQLIGFCWKTALHHNDPVPFEEG